MACDMRCRCKTSRDVHKMAVVSGTTAKALNLLTFRESTEVRSMLAEPLNSPHRSLLSRAAASVCVTPLNSLPELCVLTP